MKRTAQEIADYVGGELRGDPAGCFANDLDPTLDGELRPPIPEIRIDLEPRNELANRLGGIQHVP